jgi:hypothetical protein
MNVKIPSEITEDLNHQYRTTDNEYFYYAIGEEVNDEYIITEIIEPEIIEATDTKVVYNENPQRLINGCIGTIHSHLWKYRWVNNLCIPSENDLYAWKQMKNPTPKFHIIQCGIDKFNIYENGEI